MVTQSPRVGQLSQWLQSNPAWSSLFNAVDEVWSNPDVNIDPAINALSTLRYLFDVPASSQLVEGGTLPNLSQWDRLDKNLLAQQIWDHGLALSLSGTFHISSQWILALFLGQYYQSKGTGSLTSFFSFLLGVPIQIQPLWTQDYITFYTPIELPTGWQPIWNSGTYYPTVQCRLTYNSSPIFPTTETIQIMFDYLANASLVIYEIRANLTFSPILNMGCWAHMSIYM